MRVSGDRSLAKIAKSAKGNQGSAGRDKDGSAVRWFGRTRKAFDGSSVRQFENKTVRWFESSGTGLFESSSVRWFEGSVVRGTTVREFDRSAVREFGSSTVHESDNLGDRFSHQEHQQCKGGNSSSPASIVLFEPKRDVAGKGLQRRQAPAEAVVHSLLIDGPVDMHQEVPKPCHVHHLLR